MSIVAKVIAAATALWLLFLYATTPWKGIEEGTAILGGCVIFAGLGGFAIAFLYSIKDDLKP